MSENIDTTDPDDPRTPNGEEAVEKCPICNRWNSPGACDACEHFFGSYWDGDIIWDHTYEFEYSEAWGFCDSVKSIRESDPNTTAKLFKELGETHQMPDGWLNDVEQELSAREFLEKHNDFSCGKTIETGGMLSGSGYSLYHENPEEVEEFMQRVIRLAADLEKHVPDSEKA
jgi:hypothetical protein